MSANETQVGGDHYKSEIQHWDWVIANDLSYMQGQITKYVARYKKKNGLEDLKKARHFLDKLIEVEEAKLVTTRRADNSLAQIMPCAADSYDPVKDYNEHQWRQKIERMIRETNEVFKKHLLDAGKDPSGQ